MAMVLTLISVTSKKRGLPPLKLPGFYSASFTTLCARSVKALTLGSGIAAEHGGPGHQLRDPLAHLGI